MLLNPDHVIITDLRYAKNQAWIPEFQFSEPGTFRYISGLQKYQVWILEFQAFEPGLEDIKLFSCSTQLSNFKCS